MSGKFSRTHFPKTRLSQLIARSGGISQFSAMENANKNIATMLEQGNEIIARSIAEIGEMVNMPRPEGVFSEADLTAVLIKADQIVTLAETFSHEALATIAKSLCDLADGFLQSEIRDIAPVKVHIQSLIMVTPGGAALPDAGLRIVLDQLAKVRKHFDIVSTIDGDSGALGQSAA
jgi:hypothetical protein